MNRAFVAGIGLLAVAAAPAVAADLPVKAPPLIVAYNWNGCYVGANGGWKWGRFRDSADVPSTTATFPLVGAVTAVADVAYPDQINGNSGALGAQLGCRWETPGHWVFGVEGDFDWTNLSATSVLRTPSGVGLTFVPGDSFTDRMRWESSVRAIFGRSFDRWLVYGTAGVAFARVSMDSNYIATISGGIPFPPSAGSGSKILPGITIGGGVAYALSKNWDIGAEYRFTAYAKGDFNLGPVAGSCGNISNVAVVIGCVNQNSTGHKDLETSEILFKLNYRFDYGPIVARY